MDTETGHVHRKQDVISELASKAARWFECYTLHKGSCIAVFDICSPSLQMNRKGRTTCKYFLSPLLMAFWRHAKGTHLPRRFCRSALQQGTVNRAEIWLLCPVKPRLTVWVVPESGEHFCSVLVLSGCSFCFWQLPVLCFQLVRFPSNHIPYTAPIDGISSGNGTQKFRLQIYPLEIMPFPQLAWHAASVPPGESPFFRAMSSTEGKSQACSSAQELTQQSRALCIQQFVRTEGEVCLE